MEGKLKSKIKIARRYGELPPKNRYIFSSLIFLGIAALLLTWFLEYRYFGNDMWFSWNFVFSRPRVFLFNALLVYLLLLALWAIVGKPIVAASAMWILEIIVGYIHINKIATRAYPLLPEDFQLAGSANSLTKFVDFWSIAKLALAVVIVVIITTILIRAMEKPFNLRNPVRGKKFASRHLIGFRIVLFIISTLSFMNVTEFVRHNSGERYEDIAFLNSTFTAWNQTRNYDDNGFIVGFLYNLQKLDISEPEDYSQEYIEALNERYSDFAEMKNDSRISPADDDVNVVVILNESFFDPSVQWQGKSFEDYYPHSGGEIMPNIRKIQQKYPSGYMYTTDYGGGTANIEFETLTSLSNYWMNTVPYTAIIPKLNRVPSIATTLKDEGYTTTAIHPFNGGMYKRNISLKKEGFDEFITELEMDYADHEGDSEYINDRSAYRQTIKTLQEGSKRQAIALITMQNHTPYPVDLYENNPFKITDETIDEEERAYIATYYQSLHTSDAYLGEFIDSLEKMDKKVMVLFYGDHSAGLFGRVNENENKNVRDLSRLTPYFVYTNYDTEYKTKDLPVTTPNCIVNNAFNALNWKKSARYYLVDDICNETPILAATYYDGADFIETETQRKYRLLIYDIMSGNGYWKE